MSIQISDFKRPETVSIDSAVVQSSYGAKNILRVSQKADVFSPSGFQVSVRGLSPNSLLMAKYVYLRQPIQIRWKGTNQANSVAIAQRTSYVPNSMMNAGPNAAIAGTRVIARELEQLSLRPLGLAKSFRNITLSINGSSMSSRVESWIGAAEGLFYDGTYDEDGLSTAVPPFTNACYGSQLEKGRLERVQASAGKIVAKTYAGHALQGDTIVYEYELISRIPAGPFMLGLFPKLGTSITGNSIQCLPYIQDLSVEVSYHQQDAGPLIDWFACPTSSSADARAYRFVQGHAQNQSEILQNFNGTGLFGPQLAQMWSTVQTGAITTNAAVSQRAFLSQI